MKINQSLKDLERQNANLQRMLKEGFITKIPEWFVERLENARRQEAGEENVCVEEEKSDTPSPASSSNLAAQVSNCEDETDLNSGKEDTGNAVNNAIAAEQKRKEGFDTLHNDEVKIVHLPKAPSVEVKSKQLTVAGSFKDRRMIEREGLEAIKYLTSKGIPVKSFYDTGADSDVKSYSVNPKLEQGKRYKVCLIGLFLCFDIDRKKGVDGVDNLYRYFEEIGVPSNLLPSYLKDIGNGSYPFYMSTPSGGLHLYFKYLGRCSDGQLCEGVEIKNKQVSAGYKDGKAYILHGNIEDAYRIPPLLLDKIIPKQVKEVETKFSSYFLRKQEKKRKEWSWDKITEFTNKDGKGTQGRNERAFSLAVHARTHGFDIDETLENLMKDSDVNSLSQKELLGVVKSAYKSK